MFTFSVTDTFKQTYPKARMGILVVENIANVRETSALEKEKHLLQEHLKTAFQTREEIRADPTLQAYADYYKKFKKNYHVFFQLESVALKGKPLPNVNALVEAMFMAELRYFLLTAGHDLDLVEGTVVLDSAGGEEVFTTMSGDDKQLKANDMHVRDSRGVISSVIYGPDGRTRITEKTSRALFTVYAPEGISGERVLSQLEAMEEYIRLFSGDVSLIAKDIY